MTEDSINEKDWRKIVHAAVEATGILREDSKNNWSVRWPPAYRDKGNLAFRDNAIYHLAGCASVAVEQAGMDDVTEWEIIGYVFEILVGPEGCCQKVVEHIEQNGWGSPLPSF